MPPISTHMHFGKMLLESADDEVDKRSFVLGLVAPDTMENEDDYEDYYCLDEDGNIDVRDFYEKFDFKKINLHQKSFILGYYTHLWLDEYYKFNASKLTIHNKFDLNDEELNNALKNLVKYYDEKVINHYYDDIKDSIMNHDLDLGLEPIKHINLTKTKKLLQSYFNEKVSDDIHFELLMESEYTEFLRKSTAKIIKSI